ncbi:MULTISPECIES: sulfite exporter TauE/SafE family protein [unclassified Iodidimonas]|jgi:uncharacterized membrane protein YfcA|uniref:sulfite exporter TauE/SafE family protein n=1 Tax=unclassified Iodidimonas TaxID=2626145 RepID=UPI002482C1A9|nr:MULTISPECIES: sulfite exporter TauE/SafE family protein [unclassified Iodidimonas]
MIDLLSMAALLSVAAIVAGLLAGLLGIGGGIIMTPILFQVFLLQGAAADWRMHMAVASSLAIIAPTTFASARAHARHGSVDYQLARLWVPAVSIGAAVGALSARFMPGDALVLLFSGFAFFMAIKMLLPLDGMRLKADMPKGPAGTVAPFLIGSLASMMGIGGSTFTVPYLTLFGVPVHRALGTAALVGSLVSVVGAVGFVISGWSVATGMRTMLGFVHLPSVLLMVPLAVLAAPYGARLAHRLQRRTLSILFGCFLMLTSIRLLSTLW